MEKVRPWCGQPSDQGRLKNRTDYACDLSYFDVVLCPSSSEILATNAQISFSHMPRPPQCSLASLALVPKVTPTS